MDIDNHRDQIIERSPSPYEGRFGRFSTVLGEGAAKIVYTAIDLNYGKLVAWNEVNTSHLNTVQRQHVEAEVNLLRTVQHPNIIDFYGSWATSDKVVFITEIVESGDLQKFYRSHKVKLKVIKKWCRQILSALAYLHAHNPPIIHRDVKCENILYNATDGTVKIGDLGLSMSTQTTLLNSIQEQQQQNYSPNTLPSSSVAVSAIPVASSKGTVIASSVATVGNNNNPSTGTNTMNSQESHLGSLPHLNYTNILGTPNYMSPEQYEGICTYSIDIYAFGMCVLEMITGRLPYDECHNEGQIFKRVINGILPEAFRHIKHTSVANLITRCISSPVNESLHSSLTNTNVYVRPTATELLADPFFDETIHYPEDDEDNLVVVSPHRRNRTDSNFTKTNQHEENGIHSISVTLTGTVQEGIGHHLHRHNNASTLTQDTEAYNNKNHHHGADDKDTLAALLLSAHTDNNNEDETNSLGTSNDEGLMGSLVSANGLDQGWEIPPPPSAVSIATSFSGSIHDGTGLVNDTNEYSGPNSYIESNPLLVNHGSSTPSGNSFHPSLADHIHENRSSSFTAELGTALLDGSVLTNELLDTLNSSIKSALRDTHNNVGHYDGIVDIDEDSTSSTNDNSTFIPGLQTIETTDSLHSSSLPENGSPLSRNSYLGNNEYLSSSFERSVSLIQSIPLHELQNTATLSGTSNHDILRDILNQSQNSPLMMDPSDDRQILDNDNSLTDHTNTNTLLDTPIRSRDSPSSLLLPPITHNHGDEVTNLDDSQQQQQQLSTLGTLRGRSAGSSIGEISWTSYKDDGSRRNSVETGGIPSITVSMNNSRRGSNEMNLSSSRYSVGSSASNQDIPHYTDLSHPNASDSITSVNEGDLSHSRGSMNNFPSSFSTSSVDEENNDGTRNLHHHSYNSSGNQTPHIQYIDSAIHTRSVTPTTVLLDQTDTNDTTEQNGTNISTNTVSHINSTGSNDTDNPSTVPRPQLLYPTDATTILDETNGLGSVILASSPMDTPSTMLSHTTGTEFLHGENTSSATFLSPIVPGTGLGRMIREPLVHSTDSNDYHSNVTNGGGPSSLFSPTENSSSSATDFVHQLSTPPSVHPVDHQTMDNLLQQHTEQQQASQNIAVSPHPLLSSTTKPSYHKSSIGSATDLLNNNTITTTTMTNNVPSTPTSTNSNSNNMFDPIVKLELVLEQDNISNETGQTIVNRASIKFDFDTRIDGSSSTVAKELVSYLSSIQSLQIGESIIPFIAALLDTQRFNFRVSINGSIEGFRIWLQPITIG